MEKGQGLCSAKQLRSMARVSNKIFAQRQAARDHPDNINNVPRSRPQRFLVCLTL